MEHSFDVDVAKKYGLVEAILLKHIYFWCKHNEENQKNYYDGLYWTYNSVSAFTELFPYLSAYQIRQALKNMEKRELVVSGNYNQNHTNRSKWYAITENAKSICQKQQMDLSKTENGFVEIDKSICQKQQMDLSKTENPYTDNKPYINTDNSTTDIKPDNKSARPKKSKKDVPVKHKYGEYGNVLLSDEDIEKLDAFEPNWRVWMERVSGYCASHGKSYKNYLATIKNWIRKDREQEQAMKPASLIRGHDELSAAYQMAHGWAESEGDDE